MATILVMSLLATLAATIVMSTITEAAIAGSYREGAAMFYAAESAMEYVLSELRESANWNDLLSGKTPSGFAERDPGGVRVLGAATVDLAQATADVNALRPANTPMFTLYAYGNLEELIGSPGPGYVMVWLADRSVDGASDATVAAFAEAFGPTGSRRAVEVTFVRAHTAGAGTIRRAAWSEVR